MTDIGKLSKQETIVKLRNSFMRSGDLCSAIWCDEYLLERDIPANGSLEANRFKLEVEMDRQAQLMLHYQGLNRAEEAER